MNPSSFLLGACTIIVTYYLNAILEWVIHGPLMHQGLGGEYLSRTHREDHHGVYDDDYSHTRHGLHVHLPWWSMIMIVGIMAFFGFFISILANTYLVFWCVTLTSTAYYYTYSYVHTLMHIPVTNRFDRWVRSTRWFQRLDAHHKVHHVAEFNEPWGTLVNIGLLSTFGDWFFSTKFRGKGKMPGN